MVEGDAFRVSVVWSGEDDPEGVPSFSNPAAAPLAGPQTEQSLSIVNGRRSARRAWHWTAVPEGTGVVAFGAATLRAGTRARFLLDLSRASLFGPDGNSVL